MGLPVSFSIPTGTRPGSNAQSAVQPYDMSKDWASLSPQKGQGAALSALMDLQAAQSQYAGSPGDIAPTGFGSGGMGGGGMGGGTSDSGFG